MASKGAPWDGFVEVRRERPLAGSLRFPRLTALYLISTSILTGWVVEFWCVSLVDGMG